MHGKAIKFYLPESPCYKCESRRVGCHAEFEKFKEYRAQVEGFKSGINEAKKPDKDWMAHFAESRERRIKRKPIREQRKMGVKW